ncbi:hypothetical protein GS896_25560 [Rhodococcus hoagii]|nr:hypothetical protein [Prescottella equi]MBM4654127.1 hypothetical protein [Prescottella equi]MBM4717739.1 hypothetical protein [Prescottella equi]MBM4719602.1 hypothetical protein [Prescottella equi]NKR23400.1 hypothetical protein [Prescottella equi]
MTNHIAAQRGSAVRAAAARRHPVRIDRGLLENVRAAAIVLALMAIGYFTIMGIWAVALAQGWSA